MNAADIAAALGHAQHEGRGWPIGSSPLKSGTPGVTLAARWPRDISHVESSSCQKAFRGVPSAFIQRVHSVATVIPR
jgi:hypothetical protein